MIDFRKEVMHLLRLVETSDSLEVDVELGQKRVRIAKGAAAARAAESRRDMPSVENDSTRIKGLPEKETAEPTDVDTGASLEYEPQGEGFVVRAPIAGTFYRTPSPSSPAYCEVGDKVTADDVVCLIEVMKLFNSVSAGVDGVVLRIFAENAQTISAGDPLLQIECEVGK